MIQWLPTHRVVAVRVDQPSQLRFKTYNFRGWTARINGQVVPLLSDQDGVQLVEVPPGTHTVEARFESTPARTADTVASFLGFAIVIGLTFATRLRERKAQPVSEQEKSEIEGSAVQDRRGILISSALKPKTLSLKHLAAIAFVIVVITTIVVMTMRQSDKTGSRDTAGSAPGARAGQSVAGGSQGVGSEAHLYLEGRDAVMVAVDEKASDEIVTAISKRDLPALDALIASGRVLNAKNNTKVRVLQNTSGRTKIKILEGAAHHG